MQSRISTIIFLSFFLMTAAAAGFGENDPFWSGRHSPQGARANYENAKSLWTKNSNYLAAWKVARAAQFYGDNYCQDESAKKELFTEGKKMAETATNLEFNKVEGHYYLSVCLGLWGQANGVFQSLFAVPGILSEATKSISINSNFDDAGAFVLRGRLYQLAPGGISVGDLKKSHEDYEVAVRIAPQNRMAFRFYAELLLDTGQKTRAREIIGQGIAIPVDRTDQAGEESEISKLIKLREKLGGDIK